MVDRVYEQSTIADVSKDEDWWFWDEFDTSILYPAT